MEIRNDYTKYSNNVNKMSEKVIAVAEPHVEPVVAPMVEEIATEPEVVETIKTGVVVDCLKLNVREAPNAKADVVCVINASTNIVIDEEESTDDFYAVCTESGAEGYCMKQFIKIIP